MTESKMLRPYTDWARTTQDIQAVFIKRTIGDFRGRLAFRLHLRLTEASSVFAQLFQELGK